MNPMLTHIKITTAKPSEKLYKLHDTLGLYLAVKPNGSKLWRMNYRFLGKQKTLHLGKWPAVGLARSEEHTSELQSLMRISYAVFCLKKKKQTKSNTKTTE